MIRRGGEKLHGVCDNTKAIECKKKGGGTKMRYFIVSRKKACRFQYLRNCKSRSHFNLNTDEAMILILMSNKKEKKKHLIQFS